MTEKYTLPATIVGIDVETTSLEPQNGEIIEFAAIRYRLKEESGQLTGEEIGEYSRLTKPKHPLSAQITAITGITREMVAGKPNFSEIKDELQAFIGTDLVFAHNAAFDTGFLTYHRLNLRQNAIWDTFTLAGIAWPEAESYNLGMLADMLGLKIEGEHRAGEDVRLAWALLKEIYRQLKLTPANLTDVHDLLKKSKQEHYAPLFRTSPPTLSSLEEKENASDAPGSVPSPYEGEGDSVATEAGEVVSAFNETSLSAIFSAAGPLAKKIPNYSPRPEQEQMAEAVAGNMRNKKIAFIEAGTGIGKTFAYLVPLLQAIASGEGPVLVATYTKNLQDQLMSHDVPRLLSALGLSYRTASLKGRRNYLCVERFRQALDRAKLSSDDAWLLIKLLLWLEQGGNGDLELLNTSHQNWHLLRHLHADSLSCRTVCAREPVGLPSTPRGAGCPYQQARRAAAQADIVITNHALLVQSEGIMNGSHIVIDEAHHLEEAAREASRIDLSEHRVAELIAPFLKLSGEKMAETEAREVVRDYQRLLAACVAFGASHAADGSLRLTATLRRSAPWQRIIQQGTHLRGRLKFLSGLAEGAERKHQETILEAVREAERFNNELAAFLVGSPERIQWLEGEDVHDVALSVKEAVKGLAGRARSLLLTSATLAAGSLGRRKGGPGEPFTFIKGRLGLEKAAASQFGSSFDYRRQMLLYIVDDGPLPADNAFQSFVSEQTKQLALALTGRLLGLFTSHESVKKVYHDILKELNKAMIRLLAQKITGGRHNITARFQKQPASVLLGTYSFWEGIDVPGESLSCVVIAKLPFTPPTDPIRAAIAEAEKISNFRDLSVPEMILRLRQGIGRLIRSHTDHGVVVLLDSRFLRADYGDAVLGSLPKAKVHIGSYRDLIPIITEWFGEEKLGEWQAQAAGETPGVSR